VSWPEAVVFLKGAGTQAGSAYLRADQVCEIIAPELEAQGVAIAVRSSARGVRRSLVVVHKTALARRTDLLILLLKSRGNMIAVDFVDRAPEPRICRLADVLIASSYAQRRHFEQAFPDKPVVSIPHHADLRIATRVRADAAPRVAYFGDPANALHLDTLVQGRLCDAVAADAVGDTAWLARLADYPIHYAVRDAHVDRRFKPFTKGAVAARAGAVVVTDRNVETEQALGPDYPFFPASSGYADVRAALEAAMAAIGGPAWSRAQAAMARVGAAASVEAVRAGFAELLALGRGRRARR
jgi:hypothetical protein